MKWLASGLWLFFVSASYAETTTELGGKLFFQPGKGNCIACHQLPNDPRSQAISPKPNIGAPLENIASRYPDIALLRAIVWDASTPFPNTIMPPYGKHLILSEIEINAVITYLLTQ